MRAWSWLGVVQLLNTVLISALNPGAGISVLVWIPSFLMPFALLGHLLVFQRLRFENDLGNA